MALGAALALVLAGAGCATILGFEDTTLRTGSEIEEGGTTTDAQPGEEASVAPEGGASRITAAPASLVVRRGASAELVVDLVRGADVTGTVTARLAGLPVGVTATTATLEPSATKGTLRLSAAPTAALGPAVITLTAEGTLLPPAQIPLLVAERAGAFDATFDADGFLTDASQGDGATFLALAVQPDNRILAGGAGGATPGARNGWMLRRYAANGALDAAFHAATAALPADGELRAIALDGGGKIVCVGSSNQLFTPVLTVVRLLPSGALDATFAGGIVRMPLIEAPSGSSAYGVVIQADGAVVVVGSRGDAVEAGLITRFREDGTRDPAFNGGATVVVPDTRLVGVSLEASGAVLAAGSSTASAAPSFVLTRRTAAGASDVTFGDAGTSTFGNAYRAHGFARLASGSVALVGDVQGPGVPHAFVAGVATAQGAPVFARGFATAEGAGFFGVAVQEDSRIAAAGHTATVNGEARVERILPDGGKDLSFGDGGAAILEPAGFANGFDVTLFASAVQADGRILAAGNRSNAGAVLYRLWP